MDEEGISLAFRELAIQVKYCVLMIVSLSMYVFYVTSTPSELFASYGKPIIIISIILGMFILFYEQYKLSKEIKIYEQKNILNEQSSSRHKDD